MEPTTSTHEDSEMSEVSEVEEMSEESETEGLSEESGSDGWLSEDNFCLRIPVDTYQRLVRSHHGTRTMIRGMKELIKNMEEKLEEEEKKLAGCLKLPEKYYTAGPDKTELHSGCGFYVKTSTLAQHKENHPITAEDWQSFVRAILVEVYTENHFSILTVEESENDRYAVDKKLLSGLHGIISDAAGVDFEDMTNYINGLFTSKKISSSSESE